MADDWDALALEVKAETEAQSVKRNLTGALGVNPDKQAEINKLSAKSGVPTFSIDSPENEAWVKNMTRMNDLNPDELVKTHPMTAKALQNEDFAKIAHDDVENLKGLEDSFSTIGKTSSSTIDEVLAMTEKQAAYAGLIMLGYGPEGQDIDAMAQFIAERNRPMADVQANAPEYQKNFQKRMSEANGWLESAGVILTSPRAVARSTAANIPNMILPSLTSVGGAKIGAIGGASIGAGIATGIGQAGPQVALPEEVVTVPAGAAIGGTIGGIGGGVAGGFAGGTILEVAAWIDQELSDSGIDVTDPKAIAEKFRDKDFMSAVKNRAEAKGLTTAGIDALWNATFAGRFAKGMVPVGKIATKEGAKALTKNVGKAASDIGVGAVGESVSEAGGQLAATGKVDAGDVLLEGFSSLGQSAFDTKMYSDIRKGDVDKAAKAVAEQKLSEVQAVHDAAVKVKTTKRDSAAIRAMIEAANPDARVYIDGEVVSKYYQELDTETKAALNAAIPDIEERINDANLSGGDVMLNRSDYVAYIASNEGGRVLMEYVKFDSPDDLTVAQLSDPDYLQSLYDLSPKDNTPLTDIEVFREKITQKLRDTGRIGTQQIARESVAPIASFIQTMRERGGSETVTQSLLQGFDVQGPVSPFKSSLDITDKTINDMREYKTRTDTLFNAREKSLQTRREKAKAKAKAEGRLYIEPKSRGDNSKRHLPVLKYVAKMGGVKTNSPLAGELKNMDITPKSAPWLFSNKKGFADLDTISAEDINDFIGEGVFRNIGTSSADKTGYYVDPQDILDAIDSELRGVPVVDAPTDPMELAFEDFNQYIESLGLSLDTATNEQIKQALNDPAAFLGDGVANETADADGVTYNQDGTAKTDTEAFKKWFGDSKVVDADGNPLVVYHGTDKDFEEFDKSFIGIGGGFWFGSAYTASKFTGISEDGKNVIPVYLSIKNPYIHDKSVNGIAKMSDLEKIAKDNGHDGIIFKGQSSSIAKGDVFIAFKPTQIKSINNRGTFDQNDPRILYQSAFHGSPFKFDKFTLDHIGKGEGAQAYGWGLYFAGNKQIAEFYREKLTVEEKYVDGEVLDTYNPKHFLANMLAEENQNEESTKENLEFYSKRGGSQSIRETAKNALDLFNDGQRPIVEYRKPDGQLYEVEIPDDDVLLDWDKPLSEQPPKVRARLNDALLKKGTSVSEIAEIIFVDGDKSKLTGKMIYQKLSDILDVDEDNNDTRGDELASKALNEAGIKGIKYLDGSSRSKGSGSSNYVIFDDTAIETIKTYYQNNRGQVSIMQDGRYVVKLFETSNLSTFLHETGHIFLDAYNRYAEAPDAPEQFKTDMAGIFEYLGVKSYAEVGVEQHEKFARAFENYLRSGEAPSVALQSAFQKFKAWLSRIYQTIQELRAPVTPELKAIFDRMLATDEEISAVQSSNDGFKINDDLIAILPKADQERYERLHNKALEEAKENLFKKALKQKEREHTQWWKEERAKVRAEMEVQVNTDPLYRTIEFLKKGKYLEGDEWVEIPPIKLSRDDAIKHVGKTIMSEKMKGMTAKNGIPADTLSEMMGYVVGNGEDGYRHGTGQELLYTIVNAEDRKARIERLTNETMIERHGDMMTDGTIEKQAIEAWNTDSQALKMELEGKAAAKLAGLPFGSNTNFELAAQKILASKNIRDATNVDRFYVASVRAAKAYGKAIRSKDYPVAVKAKQQQLLSHHLYKQSVQARREMDKSLQEWKRLQKPDEKLSKSIDLNYIYVARAILGRYGVLPFNAGNLQTYFAYIQEENPEAYNDLILAVQENTRDVPQAETRDVSYTKGKMAGQTVTQTFQPWTKLSLEEFRGLKDTIDNIIGVGRNQKTMTVDGEKIQRETVIKELNDRLSELPPSSISDGQQKALEWHDKGKLALSGIRAGMRRVENWVNAMDGEYGGVFRKYIWNPINDARGNYLVAKHDYLTKMAELLKPYDDRLNNSGEIFSPEINYTFKSRAELIGMVLHMGNESNWFKLWKGGRGREWNPANVQAMMERMMNDGTITKEDMDLVQSMWDLVDGLKPDAQKAHKAMYGYYFSEITSWPVPTPWGEYRGGYWPAIPDNHLSQDARIRQGNEDLITVNNASMFPTTGRGFTKSRSEGYAAPLSFDLKLLPSHVDKVLRFVYLEPAVKDVAKLTNDKGFRNTMAVVDPRAIEEMLIPWLQRVARQTVETNDSKWFRYMDPAARWLRASTSAQVMMLNFLNAIQQITGFAPAMYKVGARPMGRALVQYMKNPRMAHEKVYEASSFMRYRNTILADNMQKAVIDIVLDTSKYAKVKDAAQAHGYIFQKIFQSWVDNTTWMAAYDNALVKNMNEKEAVRYADSIVRETQGSTASEDISKFEAGPATMRLFTMFYSYFNTQANLITTEAQNIVRSSSGLDATKKLGYLYLMTYAIPSFMAELIVRGMKDDLPDDEDDDGMVIDDWFAWFFGSQVRYGTAMVPFIGQVINSAVNAFDDKPYNDKISLSPIVNMGETLARTPKALYKAVADDGDVSRAVKDGLTSLGFVTGLPLGQLGKPFGYAADVAEGDTEIDSPLDPIRGIISGPPPADKR